MSEVLEVAIGLVFVYLLLSLMCSALTEWIGAILSLRAGTLEQGIRNLLQDGADSAGKKLADSVYESGFIKGLFKKDLLDKLLGRTGAPSYIPSHTFALALVNTLSPPAANNPQTLADLRKAIAALPDVKLRATLLGLLDEAGDDLSKARLNVERWFNDSMDRVAGWYKRKTQIVILILAIVVSAALNADSIVIVKTLVQNPTVRASLNVAAQKYVESHTTPPTNDGQEDPLKKVKDLEKELNNFNLPLGWETNTTGNPRSLPRGSEWLIKILGLLLTSIALSMGAPFWFDVLNKIMVVRSTVKPKEKSSDEASKDK